MYSWVGFLGPQQREVEARRSVHLSYGGGEQLAEDNGIEPSGRYARHGFRRRFAALGAALPDNGGCGAGCRT